MDRPPTGSTIDESEVAQFSRLGGQWWDPHGPMAALHKLNPVRLAYIRDRLAARFDRDPKRRDSLSGLRVLDLGCGGGILCEPLARLGATMVGVDAAQRNIAVARLHAQQSGLEIDYRATTAEALDAAGEKFDAVLSMEVIEHVDNVPLYMKSCASLVQPGGLLFTATINRTPRAYAFAIVGAEYVLRWLPRGTHDFRKFLTPDEIATLARRYGLRELDRTGVVFHPLADEWRQSRDLGINYMVLAEKPKA